MGSAFATERSIPISSGANEFLGCVAIILLSLYPDFCFSDSACAFLLGRLEYVLFLLCSLDCVLYISALLIYFPLCTFQQELANTLGREQATPGVRAGAFFFPFMSLFCE